MSSLLQDLRTAFRTLRRAPLITGVALATLALGIGATTAIFSILHGVLFRTLSSPVAERVMAVSESSETQSSLRISYEDLRDWQQQATAFEALAAIRSQSVTVTGGDLQPERIRGLFVTASFFDVLDERPAFGRAIAPGEDIPSGERTAVLSHGFWQRRYGGEGGAIGETVLLNNEIHTIVGVMPPEFQFPFDTTEAWISLQTYPGALNRENRTFFILGRLADGVTADRAKDEMDAIVTRLSETFPDPNRGRASQVVPITEVLGGSRTGTMLTMLLAAVAAVLLIGCANVANLQLARAAGRQREMAIRTALGGGRRRLLRQLLTENLVLATGGGLLGLAVAQGSLKLLLGTGMGWVDRLYTIRLDPVVLGFAAALTLLTGLIFGLAPALKASRTDLAGSFREGGRSQSMGARSGRLRSTLVVAQMALAVILLVAAGLLIRSFGHLQRVDLGFAPDNLLTVQFRIPGNKYETDEQVVSFFDRMIERVAAVPGVQGVACGQNMPFAGDDQSVHFLKDGVDPGADVEVPRVGFNRVNTEFFEVLGISVRAGRALSTQDRLGGSPVAVVSQRLANDFWPGEEAIGRSFRLREAEDELFTVVGVVGDIHSRGVRDDPIPTVYAPQAQVPSRFATLALRVAADPLSYSAAVREAIWELDSDQPLWEVMTQNQRIEQWIGRDRFTASLLGVFSAVALLLAALGIAGVTAYSVGQRRQEIGIRLALGAGRRRILQMIMRQGFLMVAIGLGIGLLAALALSRTLAGTLFGVEALDLLSFTVAPVLLALVALLACYLPAQRASRIDPGVTLRDE